MNINLKMREQQNGPNDQKQNMLIGANIIINGVNYNKANMSAERD